MNKRILVADDEAAGRGILRDILVNQGYDVLEAEDGMKALELLRKEKVDLLITDRAMPQMSGMELLQKLRAEKIQLPAIVVSAFGEERLWVEAIGLGAEDYILKPFDADEVLRVVKKNLEGLSKKK